MERNVFKENFDLKCNLYLIKVTIIKTALKIYFYNSCYGTFNLNNTFRF